MTIAPRETVARRGRNASDRVRARPFGRKPRRRLCCVAKGFRIAGAALASPVGEIDIVARRGGLLVFVEVKARGALDDAA